MATTTSTTTAPSRRASLGLPTLPAGSLTGKMPTAVDCLRCQLLGRRRLLCAKEDECRDVPHVFALGPILLAAWLATAIGFVVAVWR